ncbi:hypothetical protein STEG23_009480 [Scotinomys teguina]
MAVMLLPGKKVHCCLFREKLPGPSSYKKPSAKNLIQGTAQSAILSPLALGYEGSSESYTDNLEEDRKFCAISLTW